MEKKSLHILLSNLIYIRKYVIESIYEKAFLLLLVFAFFPANYMHVSFYIISQSVYLSIHPFIHPSIYSAKIIRRLMLIGGPQGLPRTKQI